MAHIQQIQTEKGAPVGGPYSQGVKVGNVVFTASVGPVDPATGQPVEKDISVQAKRVIENIKAVIEEAGGTLSNVVKVTFFLYVGDDPDLQKAHFAAVNKIYETYFTGVRPARTFIPVYNPKNLPGCSMDAIAILPK